MGILYAKVAGSWVPIINSSSAGITQAEGDVRYVNITGDTVTGTLVLPGTPAVDLATSGPLTIGPTTGINTTFDQNQIQARNNGVAAPFQINRNGGHIYIGHGLPNAPQLTSSIYWYFGSGPRLTLTPGLSGNANAEIGQQKFDTYFRTLNANCAFQFYADGSFVDTQDDPGTVDGGVKVLKLMGDGTLTTLTAPESMAAVTRWLFVGKTVSTIADPGFVFVGPTAGSPSFQASSAGGLTVPLIILNRVGAGVGATHFYMAFRQDNATIGQITRNASTAAVLYTTTSDYRLKNERGLITDAVERVKALKPRRITWKSDPDEQEQDAFFAHEVAEVVPEAVTGEKDAVADETDEDAGTVEGEIVPQGLDPGKLIPLLTAALQEALARIEALEAQLAAT